MGVFSISSQSMYSFTGSRFLLNIADQENSIGQILQISIPSQFVNVLFKLNQAFYNSPTTQGKGIKILLCQTQLIFKNCIFADNTASQKTPNLYLYAATNVTFDTCYFYNTIRSKMQSILYINGGFMQLIAESNVTIINSQFSSGYALQGGAIMLLGDSSMYIFNSLFYQNVAERSGGAISAEYFTILQISEGTQFKNNSAIQNTGSGIYASNSLEGILIQDAQFTQQTVSNIIDISDVDQVLIDNSVFSNSQTNQNTQTSTPGIHINNVNQLSISNSSFLNLASNSQTGGGALLITEQQSFKNDQNSFNITNSIFTNSWGINGAAIAAIDIENINIDSCIFEGNVATSAGGAIYFYCSNNGNNLKICSLSILNSFFLNNSAGIQGGAINWNLYEPKMKNITFSYNVAGTYGSNIASVPKQLVNVQQNQTNSTSLFTKRLLASGNVSNLQNFQSGGSIDLYFVLIDKYGTIVRTDSQSNLYIRQASYLQYSSVVQLATANFPSTIQSQTQIPCIDGLFKIKNLVFVGDPNSTQKIIFTTDGIDFGIPDNKINSGEISQGASIIGQAYVEITVSLRSCIPGEAMLSSGQCKLCDPGYYLLKAPVAPTICTICPPEAQCLGGNLIYPLPGYWRSSPLSEDFITCRNNEACIGMNPPSDNPLGDCDVGYEGVLCANCLFGYSTIGSLSQCSQCPTNTNNALRLFGLFLLMIVAILVLIRSNLYNNKSRGVKNHLPVFLRILTNHFQLLTLTANFDLEWPSELKKFFTYTMPISEVTTQFLSVDCFLQQMQELIVQFIEILIQILETYHPCHQIRLP